MENHWPVTSNLPECCMEAFWELPFMAVSFKRALATIMSVFDRGVILWMLSVSWAVGHCIENPIFKTLSAHYVKYTWSLNVLWSTYGFEIQVHSQYYSGCSWTNQYVSFQNIEVWNILYNIIISRIYDFSTLLISIWQVTRSKIWTLQFERWSSQLLQDWQTYWYILHSILFSISGIWKKFLLTSAVAKFAFKVAPFSFKGALQPSERNIR